MRHPLMQACLNMMILKCGEVEDMNLMVTIFIIIAVVFILLFTIYFFNLDMKLMLNIVVPCLEKFYDKLDRNQYL